MRTTKVVSVSLPPDMYATAERLAKEESRTLSELVREALRQYEAKRTLEGLVAYGQQRAQELGITEADVERLVNEARAEQRAEEQTGTRG